MTEVGRKNKQKTTLTSLFVMFSAGALLAWSYILLLVTMQIQHIISVPKMGSQVG